MNYFSVDEVAKKWNVSARTVQNYCKSGKIPGARVFGRSWMIPEEAELPADGRRKQEKELVLSKPEQRPLVRKSPFLDMTDLYHAPGTADESISPDLWDQQALWEAQARRP